MDIHMTHLIMMETEVAKLFMTLSAYLTTMATMSPPAAWMLITPHTVLS